MKSEDLDVIVSRLKDSDTEIQHNALKALHYEVLALQGATGINQQELLDKIPELEKIAEDMNMSDQNQKYIYNLLSVLNIFTSDQKVIKYCLKGDLTNFEEWGLQYIRKLIHCILEIINRNLEVDDYSSLVEPINNFLFKHNAEIEAVDFIFEVSFAKLKKERMAEKNEMFKKDYTGLIASSIDKENKDRVILYLEELEVFYDIKELMKTVYKNSPTKLLVYLIKNNEIKNAIDFVKHIEDPLLRKQCLYICARNMIFFESNGNDRYILSNSFMYDNFMEVVKSLELTPAIKPHISLKGINREKAESTMISSSFVHFAYGSDHICFPLDGDFKLQEEIAYSCRNATSIATNASVGAIHAFSHEKVLEAFSNKIYEEPDAGYTLALAIAAQRHHDLDGEILKLLAQFLNKEDATSIAAMLGINLLYAGSGSNGAYEKIFPLCMSNHAEIQSYAIFTLGTVFLGSGDENIILACLDTYNSLNSDNEFGNFAILGIALFFMKRPDLYKSKIFDKLDIYCKILTLGLMYVGSGSASITDEILTDVFTGDSDYLLESLGLISISLLGIGDPLAIYGIERICTASLMLESPHLQNVYPFCLGLLYASNPKPEIIDALEKVLNTGEADVSAVVALGLVGAGTKSTRILRILEYNYSKISKDSKVGPIIIIAQGLVNIGKGLFSLSPLLYHKQIVSSRSIVGLLSTTFYFLSHAIIFEHPYLIYNLTSAFAPKYVVGFDGVCRVGKPCEVVGIAGNPNKISAAVVHNLPVLLNTNERAECEDEIYVDYVEDVLIKKQ